MTTTFLRDCSHYDSDMSLAGFAGATHKVTEGTSYVDPLAKTRLTAWRNQSLPVLGSYHVLHTGNLQAQLDHWLSTLDAIAPWWRSFPHWVMQVDAEKWPGDPVTLPDGTEHTGSLHLVRHLLHPDQHAELLAMRMSTTVAFAGMLVDAGLPGWAVTYASHGQYGDSLAGMRTPLWNANYGPNDGVYPGDGSSRWAAYSGQTPVLLQYTSNPYDRNAFRGSLGELLALIGGDTMSTQAEGQIANVYEGMFHGGPSCGPAVPDAAPLNGGKGNSVFDHLSYLERQVAKVLATAAGAPTQDQVNTAVAAVMNDPAWLAKLGAALASHIKVS